MTTHSNLIRAALDGNIPYELLQRVGSEEGKPLPDVLDSLAISVANRYANGEMCFEEADAVMNAVWAVACSERFWADHGRSIPKSVAAVFEAFDAGEYHHREDHPEVDPEAKYTRPLIDAFLARSGA